MSASIVSSYLPPGYVNTLLSWKAFIPLGRLTYCAYLIHPMIIMYYMFTLRVPLYMTDTAIVSIHNVRKSN